MTAHSNITKAPLVYNGAPIRDRGDMLSLTDMWKAAGSQSGRAPNDWTSLASSREFIGAVEASFNAGNPGILTKKGKNGGSWAHWQIGLAYAKYLSPEFHMWCNQVVRDRMEQVYHGGVPADALEQIERSFGIMRMVAHKVTELEKAIPGIIANLVEPLVAARLAEKNFMLRHGKTAKQIWDAHHLPPSIKGSAAWFGNRLAEMGCSIENEGRFDRGATAIRLFDPDKAEICLRNGLLQRSRQYASERQGQGKLRLVGAV